MEASDPYDSIRFHAWNHDLQTFPAIPRMESYDVITVVSFVFHMIQSDFMPTII